MHSASTIRAPGFDSASGIARLGVGRGRRLALLASLAAHPTVIVHSVCFVRSLPLMRVVPSTTPCGLRVGEKTGSRNLARRRGFARAVLEIKSTNQEYLAGRRMQAMRTNLRHAAARGFTTCLADGAEFRAHMDERRARGRPTQFALDGQMLILLRTATASTVGTAIVTLDGEWAHLERFGRWSGTDTTRVSRDDLLLGRYLLSLALVEALRERGVRFLHAGSALAVPANVQYFQYLTGFDVVNLRVERSVAARDRSFT